MTNCLRTADKKVDNQRISLGLMSSFKSLLAMRCGCMVLKAGEKLMNRIQTNEPAKECQVFGASVVLVHKLVWV